MGSCRPLRHARKVCAGEPCQSSDEVSLYRGRAERPHVSRWTAGFGPTTDGARAKSCAAQVLTWSPRSACCASSEWQRRSLIQGMLSERKPLPQVHAIQVIVMTSLDIRAALERHWAASDASDFETEHEIYRDDAILDYPQSGERIRGRRQIQFSRAAQPNKKRFNVKRILGIDDLWMTELVLTYDGQPSYVV